MDDIILYHKTSLDLTLFEEFAHFITDHEIKNKNSNKHHEELLRILQLDGAGGTFSNSLSFARKHEHKYLLERHSYIAFCRKFSETYKKVDEKNPGEYSAIEKAFIQWRSALDKTYDVIHENIPQEKLKDFLDDNPSGIKDIPFVSNDQNDLVITEENLEKLILAINKIYKNLDKQNSEDCLFQNWIALFSRRLKYQEEYKSRNQLNWLETHLSEGEWEIFEKDDGNIIKRTLGLPIGEKRELFSRNDEITFTALLTEKTHDVSVTLTCNMMHDVIQIYSGHVVNEDDGGGIPCTEHFFFHAEEGELDDTTFFVGHVVTISPITLDMNFRICVMRKVEETKYGSKYFEYPYHSDEIPLLIKTILLEPNLESLNMSPYSRLIQSVSAIFYYINRWDFRFY